MKESATQAMTQRRIAELLADKEGLAAGFAAMEAAESELRERVAELAKQHKALGEELGSAEAHHAKAQKRLEEARFATVMLDAQMRSLEELLK